jgi:signal transduction histidine kinase
MGSAPHILRPMEKPEKDVVGSATRTRAQRTHHARLSYHISASLVAFAVIGTMALVPWDGANSWITDTLWRVGTPRRAMPEIRLVAFDDASAYRYDSLHEGIPATELIALAEFLAEAKPRAVAILTALSAEMYSPSELQQIGAAFEKLPRVYLGYTQDALLGRQAPEPLRSFAYFPAFISRDSQSYAADAISRRVMVEIDSVPSLYAAMANDFNPEFGVDRQKYERNGTALQTYIRWQGPPGTYPIDSSRRILDGDVAVKDFADKTVVIGSLRQRHRTQDFTYSPFQRAGSPVPSLEVAAHGLVTLIRNDGVQKSPLWIDLLTAFFVGVVTVNMVLWLSPGKGILFLLGGLGVLLTASWVLLHIAGLWVGTGMYLVAMICSYYLVIPFRLVFEYRRRSHYQEKSEWMSQLEQLKSHFLSLVSHDLKTPVATIQGNAEIALRDEALPEHLKPIVNSIVQTTEHLSEYVESVLDLTRIESAEVPLQKTTRDINSTIREVVVEKEILAREKNIEVAVELEPLFSFKYDVRLMKRVLANLLENAIKYCPANSRILLTSQEQGDFICITVADNGPGIAPDERTRIFDKFYRGSDFRDSAVKGSGLGLYLVKYFVELHQGLVNIQSELGQGTSFTVQLPVRGGV